MRARSRATRLELGDGRGARSRRLEFIAENGGGAGVRLRKGNDGAERRPIKGDSVRQILPRGKPRRSVHKGQSLHEQAALLSET